MASPDVLNKRPKNKIKCRESNLKNPHRHKSLYKSISLYDSLGSSGTEDWKSRREMVGSSDGSESKYESSSSSRRMGRSVSQVSVVTGSGRITGWAVYWTSCLPEKKIILAILVDHASGT